MVAKSVVSGAVTRQQGAQVIPNHFTFGGVLPGGDLGFHGFGHLGG